jgi:hypothetical protein
MWHCGRAYKGRVFSGARWISSALFARYKAERRGASKVGHFILVNGTRIDIASLVLCDSLRGSSARCYDLTHA